MHFSNIPERLKANRLNDVVRQEAMIAIMILKAKALSYRLCWRGTRIPSPWPDKVFLAGDLSFGQKAL
ncbi:MAG: hypothetical protein NUV74_09935 [Candidatus Brocadiaceae bacterium]|nr:hypothetical protein [Candidatus Brocadiaceae bacterium]